MENTNASSVKTSATTAWLLVGVSTVGMLIFAAMYFSAPKASQENQMPLQVVPNTVVKTVTNEVVREVPKEVVKHVEVPAQIPDGYLIAMDILQKMSNATPVARSQVLFRMNDVQFVCFISDEMKPLVSESEVRAKFELTLRRNSVPLNPSSRNVVLVAIDGFYRGSEQALISYIVSAQLSERHFLFRDGECHTANVKVWVADDAYGSVGKAKANETFLGNVEKFAEMFANDFLSANPKK